MVTTLEIFGLPQDYINGCGHHSNWRAGDAEKKKQKGKAKKKVPYNAAAAKLRNKHLG